MLGLCNYVQCKYGTWSAWTTTCGKGQRSRQMETIKKTVQGSSCNGLPTSCPTTPDIESRTKNCEYQLLVDCFRQWCAGRGARCREQGTGNRRQGANVSLLMILERLSSSRYC